MSYRRTRHAVYLCNYHFIWIPKRRKPVLLGLFLKCIDTGIRDAIIVLEKDVEVGDRIYRIAEEAGINIIYASDIESISF